MVREANKDDLDEILQLYLYLHEDRSPEDSEHLRNIWDSIASDRNHHLIVCEVEGKLVASCACVIIPNHTGVSIICVCRECGDTRRLSQKGL